MSKAWAKRADAPKRLTGRQGVERRKRWLAEHPLCVKCHPGAQQAIADSFLAAMRDYSIPMRLVGMLRRPMLTRLFFSNTGVVVGEVAEGAPIPVVRGDWSQEILRPRKFAGIHVITEDLARSTEATAGAAIIDDLAAATAAAENLAFLNPEVTGSVLDGASEIGESGTNAAAIASDLQRLFELINGKGRGLALAMHEQTAAHIHFSDPAKFPAVGPLGGSVAGVPVLISDAAGLAASPGERVIGLSNATQIYWADRGRVRLDTAKNGALQMDGAPSAGASSLVSLMQADAVATRAIRESSWYARSGAGAFLRVTY